MVSWFMAGIIVFSIAFVIFMSFMGSDGGFTEDQVQKFIDKEGEVLK